jgi:hypothetical protein
MLSGRLMSLPAWGLRKVRFALKETNDVIDGEMTDVNHLWKHTLRYLQMVSGINSDHGGAVDVIRSDPMFVSQVRLQV